MVARALLLTALYSAVLVSDAAACSCAYRDARERMAAADRAFTGTVTRKETLGTDGGGRVRYTFDVEQVHKGQVADPFVSEGSAFEASCGVTLAVGERAAFALSPGSSSVSLCGRFDVGEIEEAAAPFPAGAGRGRLAFLVAATLGDAGAAAYSTDGTLLGYVFGARGRGLDVCPGGRYAVQAGDDLALVRVADLAVVRRTRLRGDDAAAARCLNAAGTDVAVHVVHYGRPGGEELVRVRAGRTTRLARVNGEAAFGRDAAIVVSNRGAQTVSYAGRRRVLLRESSGGPRISPDGRLAAVSTETALKVITLASGAILSRPTRGYHQPLWVDARRVALTDGRGRAPVYALPGLTAAGTLPSGDLGYGVPTSSGVVGVSYGPGAPRLVRARRGASKVQRLATLPVTNAGPVVHLPARPRITAPTRAASPTGTVQPAPSASQARSASPCSSSEGGGSRTSGRSPSSRSIGRGSPSGSVGSIPSSWASVKASLTVLMGPAGTDAARSS
jgi:hypothetical protein